MQLLHEQTGHASKYCPFFSEYTACHRSSLHIVMFASPDIQKETRVRTRPRPELRPRRPRPLRPPRRASRRGGVPHQPHLALEARTLGHKKVVSERGMFLLLFLLFFLYSYCCCCCCWESHVAPFCTIRGCAPQEPAGVTLEMT